MVAPVRGEPLELVGVGQVPPGDRRSPLGWPGPVPGRVRVCRRTSKPPPGGSPSASSVGGWSAGGGDDARLVAVLLCVSPSPAPPCFPPASQLHQCLVLDALSWGYNWKPRHRTVV